MTHSLRLSLVPIALALALPAAAQQADAAGATSNTVRARGTTPAPARTVHSTASSKAVLVPFGPYITQTGVGASGADVSELYTAVGYNWYGLGFQAGSPNLIADEFVVPAGETWTVDTVRWIAYQTGAPTSGTITAMFLNLWNTDPTGQLPGGQSTTGGDQYQSQVWTGVYRVLDTDLTAINRALIDVTCDGAWMPAVGAGTYFLEASANGSLTSGPWTPPLTVAGQTPPTGATYYSVQSVGGGAFAQVFDQGNPTGIINEPVDFVWQLEGTGGSSGFQTFCNSRPSSLPSCTPSLDGPTTVNKSGSPAANITAGPVPGGNFPSILIYTKNGLTANPINTQFGELCLNQFLRAGNPSFVAFPGGTSGVCDGSYSYDMAAIAAFYSQIGVGDTLYVQAWYRDPGNPGTANFTEAGGTITVQ